MAFTWSEMQLKDGSSEMLAEGRLTGRLTGHRAGPAGWNGGLTDGRCKSTLLVL